MRANLGSCFYSSGFPDWSFYVFIIATMPVLRVSSVLLFLKLLPYDVGQYSLSLFNLTTL
jgi:hypothetical protein